MQPGRVGETEAAELSLSKAKALEECAELQGHLLNCFKTCSLFTPFCCSEENKAFWECYKYKRGMGDETHVSRIFKTLAGPSHRRSVAQYEREPQAHAPSSGHA
eukprot:jgi/Botrbrau1/3046/Bobra.0070s0042.1